MGTTGGLWRERVVASNNRLLLHRASVRPLALLLAILVLILPAVTAAATLNPIADAHVRAGTNNVNTNFGTANPLVVRTNATAGNNFDGYLKFDLSTVTAIASARVSLHAALNQAGSITTTVHAVADTTWGETTITWNTRPPLGTVLGTITVASTTFTRYELDITSYLQAEKAAGRNLITLGLHNTANTTQQLNIRPREAVVANRPQLIITENLAPTVNLVTPINNAVFSAPANITLTAEAADTDGTITNVEFFNGATKLGEDNTSPYTFDWTNVTAGTYSLTTRATDNAGATTTSAPVSLTVNALPINYTYDELGRLIRVIDGNGRSAIYEYDQTGNRIKVTPSDIANTAPTITSITPDFIRLGTPKNIRITGTNLNAAKITPNDPNITATIVAAQPTELTVRLTASNSATTGSKTISIANTAGSADTPINVRPALTVTTVPSFIVVPPDGSPRQVTLRLSDTSPETVRLDLAVSNALVASVSPGSVVLEPGQMEVQVVVVGRQIDWTYLNVASTSFNRLSRLNILVQNNLALTAPAVNLLVTPLTPSPTPTSIGPVIASHVRVVREAEAAPPSSAIFGPVLGAEVRIVKATDTPAPTSQTFGPVLAVELRLVKDTGAAEPTNQAVFLPSAEVRIEKTPP